MRINQNSPRLNDLLSEWSPTEKTAALVKASIKRSQLVQNGLDKITWLDIIYLAVGAVAKPFDSKDFQHYLDHFDRETLNTLDRYKGVSSRTLDVLWEEITRRNYK